MGRLVWGLVTGFLVVTLALHTSSLSCFCGPPEDCEAPQDCGDFGTEMDACACCLICKRKPDEDCGGPFNVSGHCGTGLECVKDLPPNFDGYDQFFGVCGWATRPSRPISFPNNN